MSRTILTVAGRYFDFERPEDHPYDIKEIAHALSQVNRYTGHTRYPYSVAQHSVLASYQVPKEMALTALLHDASEAYLGDVSTHLKALLPEYKVIEQRTEAQLAKVFGTIFPLPVEVKVADARMLMTEVRDLMPLGPRQDWPDAEAYPDVHIRQWHSLRAETLFRARYQELIGGRLSD